MRNSNKAGKTRDNTRTDRKGRIKPARVKRSKLHKIVCSAAPIPVEPEVQY